MIHNYVLILNDFSSIQAVYVCCRDDNFDTAKEVYSRLFLSNSKEGENGKEVR